MRTKFLCTILATFLATSTVSAQSLTAEGTGLGEQTCLSQRSKTTCIQMINVPDQSNLIDRLITYNKRGRIISQSRGRKDLIKKLADRNTLRLYNKLNAEAARNN